MSKDPRENIVETIKNLLFVAGMEQEKIRAVLDAVIIELGKYHVEYSGTEVGFLDDGNENYLKLYMGTLYTEGKSKNTIAAYETNMKRFFRDVNKPVTEVSVYDVRLWLAELQKSISLASCENYRSVVNAFYNWMVSEEFIPKNPMAKIKPIKHSVPQEYAFTEVEIDALRTACDTLRERAVLEVLYSTGMRVTELADLDIADIDFARKSILIRHGKGDKSRTVYFTDLCALHVRNYLKTREDDFPQFLLTRNRTRMNKNTLDTEMKNVAKRAGVKGMHCHRLRKTNAVNLLSRGVDVRTIQKLLGHANLDVTTRYLGITDSHVEMQYRAHTA